VPTFKLRSGFVIGAAIGGLAGALYAGRYQFVNNESFDVVTSMLFLRRSSSAAPATRSASSSARSWCLHPAALRRHRQVQVPDLRYRLIVLMIFRPQGLLGARQRLLAYAGRRIRPGRKGEQSRATIHSPTEAGTTMTHRDDSAPSVPVEAPGGEVEQMSEEQRAEHFAEVAEVVAPDRESRSRS